MKALIVVTDPSECDTLEGTLSQVAGMQYTTDCVHSYADGLVAIEAKQHDLYLVDYRLSEHQTGLDLVHMAFPGLWRVPLILFLEEGDRDVAIESISAAGAAYLVKSSVSPLMLELSIRHATMLAQIMEALRWSEERYRAIVEDQAETVCRFLPDGTLTFVNEAYCRYYEKERLDLIGNVFTPTVYEDDQALIEHLRTSLSQEHPVITYMHRVMPSGEGIRWQQRTERAIFDEQGDLIEYQSVGRDVTDRVRAEEAEREQRALAEALRDTAAVLNSTLDLDEVLDRILGNIGSVVKHDVANVMLISEGTARIVRTLGYTSDYASNTLTDINYVVKNVPTLNQMAVTGKPIVVANTQTHSGWVSLPEMDWLRSYAGAPIMADGEVLGFLNLDSSQPYAFTHKDASRLMAFADQAASGIRNARSYEQAQELATFEERQRLARDLHDAVSQTLFSASVIAQSVSLQAKGIPGTEKLVVSLGEIEKLARGALAEMRTLLFELRPEALLSADLEELLNQLAMGARARLNAEVTCDVVCGLKFPTEVKIMLYRITQEALNNIVKHARPKHVKISLACGADIAKLSIVDDGRGFDLENTPLDRLGLTGMRERAASIDAELVISSRVGEGSAVNLTWRQQV